MIGALAFSLTIAAATPAVQTGQAALAVKLAQAIAGTHGRTAAKIYVGALPPGAKITVPLPKFTLLGSVVETPSAEGEALPMGSSTTFYYELPPNGENALDAYQKQLSDAGWKSSAFFKRIQNQIAPNGGFAVTRVRPRLPAVYCDGRGGVVSITRARPSQFIGLEFTSSSEASAFCVMSAALNAMPSPAPAPQLPTLEAPPNVTMQSRLTVPFMESSAQSEASITSTEPLATMGPAFAQQLVKVGWSADDAAQSSTAYVQTFHMTKNGQHYYAVLSLLGSGKTQHYDATLRAVNLDARSSAGGGFPFPFSP
jgi:hypothetical protein